MMTGFLFVFFQGGDVPGIEYEGFFANGVGADAEGEPNMRIVQVIRGADGNVIDLAAFATELFQVSIETFELDKEIAVGEEAVEDADGIAGIQSGDEEVAGIFDGLEMAGRDIASGADESEGFHGSLPFRRMVGTDHPTILKPL